MTDEMQEEPGFGKYRDRDGIPGEVWEHAEKGWRFTDGGAPRRQPWVSWGTARHYSPFTPIESAPTEESAPKATIKPARVRALELAVKAWANVTPQGNGIEIISTAKQFENYLTGGE